MVLPPLKSPSPSSGKRAPRASRDKAAPEKVAPEAATESYEAVGVAAEPPAYAAPRPEQQEAGEASAFAALDLMQGALVGQMTGGLSPAALALAMFDWSVHLAQAPGKRMELLAKAWRKNSRLAAQLAASITDPSADPCIEPLPGDDRFRDEAWQQMPYRFWYQAFLLNQQWWHNATHDVPGTTPHHEDVVSFCSRQILDLLSPANNPFTNPEVIARTRETGGANLAQGFANLIEDMSRLAGKAAPAGADAFVVGRDVAATPGKVVFRNELIELIQYEPATETVAAEPVLIVPAWIMKYYILDLSPHNSLVRYLVSQGRSVFCISWRNPGTGDRDLALDDYRRLGVMAALDAIAAIVPGRQVHATGYCLGGTLLAIAAAAMAHAGDARLASLTLLAAQTDFSEPGELALFIDHSQMQMLDAMMWQRGYLAADQMAGAFQLLRSNDLIWSHMVRDYMMGERTPMIDLMAWNADTTRMPYRMHSEYLRRLYLDNALATGRLMVEGRPVALQNIRAPIFAVGTERDHVAPWRSVYKIHYLTDADVSFLLTSGGHNAGIVSEPGRPRRHYQLATKARGAECLGADEWERTASRHEGSWWPAWVAWLDSHDSSMRQPPPLMGNAEAGYPALMPAPGSYVLEP